MHDWTFVGVKVFWKNGTAKLFFISGDGKEVITVREFVNLKIPRKQEWGSSISVYEVAGPKHLSDGSMYLSIEMQSGDKIEVEAKEIYIPNGVT